MLQIWGDKSSTIVVNTRDLAVHTRIFSFYNDRGGLNDLQGAGKLINQRHKDSLRSSEEERKG